MASSVREPVYLRADGVLLPLQELVEKKEEPNIACRKTFKGKKSGGRSGGSLGNKWRQKKGALGNRTPVTGLWSYKGVSRIFGALAGFVPWLALCRVISQ